MSLPYLMVWASAEDISKRLRLGVGREDGTGVGQIHTPVFIKASVNVLTHAGPVRPMSRLREHPMKTEDRQT